ncbi:MAG: ATP-binding protein, partial [Desulfuromonadales bacterium]
PWELDHMEIRPGQPGPLRALGVAPMYKRDEVIGALVVGSIAMGAYRQEDLSFVQHLADQLSISIQNSRLYEQVSRAKKEWEETFKAVTDPIFLVDTDYNVLLHNDRMPPEMSGFWNRALNNKCFAKLHGRTHPCRGCPIQEVQQTGKPVFQRWQTDGGLLLDLSYYPVLNEDKHLAAVTIILKDVTRKTQMEAQLVHSAKLAALGEMAAGVAHELNSPMTVIIGTAQMLVRELRQEAQEDKADVLSVFEELDPDLPKLTANGSQIQQVLTNLLVNARDALSEVKRKEKLIEVTTTLRRVGEQSWAVLSVRDNGTGIERDNLAKIFTPFYTSKEASKGTGLGLSVSLGIAESHNGTIEVDSEPGKGSTFSLVLPLDQS